MLSLFHFISGCKQDQTYACGQQVNPPGYAEPEASRHIQRHAQGRSPGKVQPGSIVLFHNAAKHTPEALPSILTALIQEGYTFVPISQIILDGEYTIDHTGRQCPA